MYTVNSRDREAPDKEKNKVDTGIISICQHPTGIFRLETNKQPSRREEKASKVPTDFRAELSIVREGFKRHLHFLTSPTSLGECFALHTLASLPILLKDEVMMGEDNKLEMQIEFLLTIIKIIIKMG